MARQRDLPESTKDDIRSKIASTPQLALVIDCNLTKDELHAFKRRSKRHGYSHTSIPTDEGRVFVVMDKKYFTDKMNLLVYVKQIYELLKRDPAPAFQRGLEGKPLDLKEEAENLTFS